MPSGNHAPPSPVTTAGFRVSVSGDLARIDAAVAEFCDQLREPVAGHPNRCPSDVEPAAWRRWFTDYLPITVLRIGELLLIGMRQPGFGQPWAMRVLAPLAALAGCDVVPRAAIDERGTITDELAEANIAVSALVTAVNTGATGVTLAAHLERAKAELTDLVEVSR